MLLRVSVLFLFVFAKLYYDTHDLLCTSLLDQNLPFGIFLSTPSASTSLGL
jgi:hypothetical protein